MSILVKRKRKKKDHHVHSSPAVRYIISWKDLWETVTPEIRAEAWGGVISWGP